MISLDKKASYMCIRQLENLHCSRPNSRDVAFLVYLAGKGWVRCVTEDFARTRTDLHNYHIVSAINFINRYITKVGKIVVKTESWMDIPHVRNMTINERSLP